MCVGARRNHGFLKSRASAAAKLPQTEGKAKLFPHFGGKNSPYIWFKCPFGMGSWEFFDKLLNEAEVVGTPGEGFGKNGDGWFRLTAFNTLENTIEAMERFKKLCKGE